MEVDVYRRIIVEVEVLLKVDKEARRISLRNDMRIQMLRRSRWKVFRCPMQC